MSLSLLVTLFVRKLQETIDWTSDNVQREISFLDHCFCNWVDHTDTVSRNHCRTVELDYDVALQFARRDICIRSIIKEE
jgi:hypothetical protein